MAITDIYVYPESKGKASGIRIPWLPDEIETDFGDIRTMDYEIMDNGEVNVPNGSNLGRFSWQGIFPGTTRKLPFFRGTPKDPKTYEKKLNEWKTNGEELILLIAGTNINQKVFCEKFVARYSGGFGDISYEVTFKGRRKIEIKTLSNAAAATKSTKNQTKQGTASGKSYTIKSGDTLWGISVKFLGKGTRWKEIYNLNKSIIESTAKKRGKKDSDGGHWIFPGTVIKIPAK